LSINVWLVEVPSILWDEYQERDVGEGEHGASVFRRVSLKQSGGRISCYVGHPSLMDPPHAICMLQSVRNVHTE